MKIAIILSLYAMVLITDSFGSNSSLPIEGKVFGGLNVGPESRNYVVSLRHHGSHFCTGFLISEEYVLTAAQCLHEFILYDKFPEFKPYTVVIGNAILNDTVSHAIEQVEVHRRYVANTPTSFYYDVGVITLMTVVEETKHVGWIEMSDKKLKKLPAKVQGWKVYNNEINHKVNFFLKEIKVKLQNKMQCNITMLNAPIICSLCANTMENLGPEDIGAPLIQNDKAIGVLSVVPQKPGDPSFYVDINKALYYIKQMMKSYVKKRCMLAPRKRIRYDSTLD